MAGKSIAIEMINLEQALNEVESRPAAYVLVSADGEYWYKGACRDLAKRVRDHQSGRVLHTKNRRPLGIVHFEYCADFSEAQGREKFFKSGAGRKWLKEQYAARVAEWQTQRT